MNKLFILTRNQVREIDRRAVEEFGIPSIILMENAGRGMAEFLFAHSIHGRIIICCGKGNNGGDGFVIARHLYNHNLSIQILLFADPADLKGDAKVNFEIATKMGLPVLVVNDHNLQAIIEGQFGKADWIIDALLGTGLRGEITSFYNKIIQSINQCPAKIVSVDIPSGLECDTGKPLCIAVKANYTLTISCFKKGFTYLRAKEFLGEVHIIDLGVEKIMFRNKSFTRSFTRRPDCGINFD